MWMAMLCAAAITAQFVGGKATRDALFLSALNVTALPTMLIATSICSIFAVAAYARWSRRFAPSTLVPASFVVSALLFVAEWLFRANAPAKTAVVAYLHVSGAAPLLASGFWLIVSERFDPRTAKRRFWEHASAGAPGGLFGGLLVRRGAASVFRVVLRGNEPDFVRSPDDGEPRRARTVRPRADDEHAIDCTGRGGHCRYRCAGPGQHPGRAWRRVNPPRLVVPCRIRAVLHADPGAGQTRGQADYRCRR